MYILSHLDYYWQHLTPCSSKTNLSLNVTNQTTPDHNTGILNSKWPYYWLYFSNWCFTVFVISFVADTVLVMKRYLLENVQFKNIVQLELWYIHFYNRECYYRCILYIKLSFYSNIWALLYLILILGERMRTGA